MESTVSKISYKLLSPFIKTMKIKETSRCVYITSRGYCDNKSLYTQEEEGKKERMVYGVPYPEWRKPYVERDGAFRTKLAVFNTKNPSPEILNAMQKLPHLNFQVIKEWWANMKTIQEIQNQKYLPERTAALGSNLAAIHFFLYRHCAVRLKNSKEWITGLSPALNLPNRYVDGYFVEAVDCTNFHHNGIRYEGIQNLSGLNFLKWLSLRNNKHIDVWCLDRLAGQNGKSLEYLDLRGCKLTASSVYALAKMTALKQLVITDPGDDLEVQAALSMLESEKSDLIIKSEFVDDTQTVSRK